MYKVDVYLRVRRAVMVEGMSIRETARTFGLHRDTVRKMPAYSVPPGYRRQSPPGKPKLKPFTGIKHLVLCRLEGLPPRLDLELYPYLPRIRVSTTSAGDYMTLLSGRAA